MGLIAWTMLAAARGLISSEGSVARLLCLTWVVLGAWLLHRRWRSRP
jgi:hypothetical protein